MQFLQLAFHEMEHKAHEWVDACRVYCEVSYSLTGNGEGVHINCNDFCLKEIVYENHIHL